MVSFAAVPPGTNGQGHQGSSCKGPRRAGSCFCPTGSSTAPVGAGGRRGPPEGSPRIRTASGACQLLWAHGVAMRQLSAPRAEGGAVSVEEGTDGPATGRAPRSQGQPWSPAHLRFSGKAFRTQSGCSFCGWAGRAGLARGAGHAWVWLPALPDLFLHRVSLSSHDPGPDFWGSKPHLLSLKPGGWRGSLALSLHLCSPRTTPFPASQPGSAGESLQAPGAQGARARPRGRALSRPGLPLSICWPRCVPSS